MVKDVEPKSEGRTRFVTNHKILIFCLFFLAITGTMYYFIDDRKEVYEAKWLAASTAWYIAISFSIIAVFRKTRIGYLTAGILSWITLTLWMFDNYHVVSGVSFIAAKPNMVMTVRNFIGSAIASLGIISSHNAFHKISRCKIG
ncbi:MAG: hypothetical protein PXX83_04995 [Candidatus Nitrosotalea sp.]|nr:hypothetical protein [Candidatus Nitrosotalea sp.]